MVPKVWFSVLGFVVLVLVLVVPGEAQVQPRFASATVRPTHMGRDARPVARVTEDGGYFATNVTLKRLLENAYARSGFDLREVAGGPDWLATDRFDITATSAAGLIVDEDGFARHTLLMLQELLKEQFKLRGGVREQSRAAYALVTTGGAGPQLQRSALDCAAVMRAFAKGERGGKLCGAAPYPGRLVATGLTMPDLAALVGRSLDRPVIDRTGLRGFFDVQLEGVEFRPEGPFGPSYRPSNTTRSVFEHIGPQLGLKLEPVTAPIEVLVIDHAERPREVNRSSRCAAYSGATATERCARS